MKPPGPLMIEHRLIERMLRVLDYELDKMMNWNKIDPHLIQTAVDFFRTYADQAHHGKEEGILFRDLKNMKITLENKTMMNSLIQDHVFARKIVGELEAANVKFIEGDGNVISEIISQLQKLIDFYPRHIEKEEKHFFIAVMDYFSEEQQQNMLKEFWEFDRKLIHEKYAQIIEEAEKHIL